MNTGKFRTKVLTIILAIFPFSALCPGAQFNLYDEELELPCTVNESFSVAGNYGSKVYVQTDSGANWRNITIGISCYVYGVTRISNLKLLGPINFDKVRAVNNEFKQFSGSSVFQGSISAAPAGFLGEEISGAVSDMSPVLPGLNNIPVKDRNPGNSAPMLTLNFLIKVTGTITFHIENIEGKNIVTVSREKLVKRSYNLNVDGTEVSKNTYCHKSGFDKHTLTGTIVSNSDAG